MKPATFDQDLFFEFGSHFRFAGKFIDHCKWRLRTYTLTLSYKQQSKLRSMNSKLTSFFLYRLTFHSCEGHREVLSFDFCAFDEITEGMNSDCFYSLSSNRFVLSVVVVHVLS